MFSIGSSVYVASEDFYRYIKGLVLTKDDNSLEILLENEKEIEISIETNVRSIITNISS